jgi:hypothetical protein
VVGWRLDADVVRGDGCSQGDPRRFATPLGIKFPGSGCRLPGRPRGADRDLLPPSGNNTDRASMLLRRHRWSIDAVCPRPDEITNVTGIPLVAGEYADS